MKRSLILSLAVAILAPISFIGCAEETKTTEKSKVETPTGGVEKTVTTSEKKTGDEKEAPK